VPKMTVAASKLANAPLYIEQASGFTVGQLCAIARRLNQKHGLKLIVIDYLQRLHGVGDNQEQKIASISAGVKDLAMELAIPIILLSQVNKEGMTKHAAATTEDCDSLWKLENDGDWQNQIQPVNLNVEKCRDGETGQIPLLFYKKYTRFENAAKITEQDKP
jgi:replicative DNA helicase